MPTGGHGIGHGHGVYDRVIRPRSCQYWEEEASDLEEEETGKPSKPRQAKEEVLQVAAWLDKATSSRTNEQRMVTLGKRRRSCLEEMTPSQIVMLRSVPYSSSQAGFYSDSDLLSAGDSRRRSIITL